MRNNPLLGPYIRTIPRVLWWSGGGGLFLMSDKAHCTPYGFGFRRGREAYATVLHSCSLWTQGLGSEVYVFWV